MHQHTQLPISFLSRKQIFSKVHVYKSTVFQFVVQERQLVREILPRSYPYIKSFRKLMDTEMEYQFSLGWVPHPKQPALNI